MQRGTIADPSGPPTVTRSADGPRTQRSEEADRGARHASTGPGDERVTSHSPSWRPSLAMLTSATGAAAHPHGYNTSQAGLRRTPARGMRATSSRLINSGEEVFGDIFEGIPDGIGVVPGKGQGQPYVDMYVAHEQSHVPFGGFSDFQDSSVSRVRVDVSSKRVTNLDVVLSPKLGLIRFCSAFMAGPRARVLALHVLRERGVQRHPRSAGWSPVRFRSVGRPVPPGRIRRVSRHEVRQGRTSFREAVATITRTR